MSAPAPSAPPQVAQQPAPALAAAAPGQPASVRLEIRATTACWIRVAASGKPLFSGVLEPNQSRAFEGNQPMQVRIGNAGGLEIRWNGKPVGPLGAPGQVREFEFTSAAFKALAVPSAKLLTPDDGL